MATFLQRWSRLSGQLEESWILTCANQGSVRLVCWLHACTETPANNLPWYRSYSNGTRIHDGYFTAFWRARLLHIRQSNRQKRGWAKDYARALGIQTRWVCVARDMLILKNISCASREVEGGSSSLESALLTCHQVPFLRLDKAPTLEVL